MHTEFSNTLKRIQCGIFLVFLVACVSIKPVLAQDKDTVAAVLDRMKSTSAVRIAYREIRYLELFEKPVESSGMLYGLQPDLLIKEQRQPTREVMGIFGDHAYYFNPGTGVRHSRSRSPDDPIDLHIGAFQALANGNQDLLNDLYDVSFYTEPGYWYMILTEKSAARSQIRITISGSSGQPADTFELHEADGDRSVYRLVKDGEGEKVRIEVEQLEAELSGE